MRLSPLIGVLAVLLFLSSVLWAAKKNAPPAAPGFTSAKVCGQCHEAIHKGWEGSMHANAVSDPIFYTIFLENSRQTGGKSDALCLSCHAPTTRVTKNLKLEDPLTAEGVTCDFCHRVREVQLEAADPFVLETGKKKWGPLPNIESPFHETAQGPHFEQSAICAGCHEFKNSHGVPILETYSEWKNGPYPKAGKECQDCHMPEIEGLPVPPRVKPVKEVYINSHEAAGGHSVAQLKKAVVLKIEEVRRADEKIHCVVQIQNVGSGHKVPTGLPTRKLVLRLEAQAKGEPLYAEERVFQKILLDPKGLPITRDADVFLNAARVQSDNRLAPGETRTEHFSFFAPAGLPVSVQAKVFYLYQPRLIQETEMRVDLGGEERRVP